MLSLLGRRIRAAAVTVPTGAQWARVGLCLTPALVCLPIGLRTGFLTPTWHQLGDLGLVAQVALRSLLAPGIVEELVFRAALLPHPAVDPPTTLRQFAAATALPLAAFVAMHVVNPRAESRAVFRSPAFLVMAGLLGVGCTAAYRVSRGSLAAAALVHWLPVAAWLLGLGGLQKLGHV